MIRFPDGLQLEPIRRSHARAAFACGQAAVEAWLSRSALQAHDKHLSVTKVVADSSGVIAEFYTLAAGQVDAGELPAELGRRLPRRALPTAVILKPPAAAASYAPCWRNKTWSPTAPLAALSAAWRPAGLVGVPGPTPPGAT